MRCNKDQCELSRISSSGRGWCQFGAAYRDFAVEGLEKQCESATFLQCCREGHSSLSIISFTLEVLMTNRAASSVPLMFCLVCGSHTVQAYSSMGWMMVLQAVTFNWVALILRLYHTKPCWPWSRWYVCADPSSDPAVW